MSERNELASCTYNTIRYSSLGIVNRNFGCCFCVDFNHLCVFTAFDVIWRLKCFSLNGGGASCMWDFLDGAAVMLSSVL